MADAFQPVRYSPLAGLPAAAGGIELSERPFLGKINLRGDADDAAFARAVGDVLDLPLPLAPNTVAVGADGQRTVFWLGPDEWLIHTPTDGHLSIISALREALSGQHAAVTDVGDYYQVIRITGAKAREVLSKGTPFNVNAGAFDPGACAQTVFGHASILLHCLDDAPTFDIQVRWSFADYVWTFLVDGSTEYQ